MSTFTRPEDPSRDFCQWDYPRPSVIHSESIRQENILFNVARDLDRTKNTENLLRVIQKIAGNFNTVWGIKSSGTKCSIELYFYDYDRKFLSTNPRDILQTASQFLSINLETKMPAAPFFMWSMEIDPTGSNKITDIDLYFSGVGGTISSGECYTLTKSNYEFKNIYYFFESIRDQDIIYEALTSGPRLRNVIHLPSFLHPARTSEQIYVVARKRLNDGVYLSRLPLGKGVETLKRVNFDRRVLSFLQENSAALEHHLYDIGIDYKVEESGEIFIEKSAIYGIF